MTLHNKGYYSPGITGITALSVLVHLSPVSVYWRSGSWIYIQVDPCAVLENPPTAILVLALSTSSVLLSSSAHHMATARYILFILFFISSSLVDMFFCFFGRCVCGGGCLPGRKGHIGRGSLAVSLTCISCPPNVATIAVTLQHWHIWRPLTPSLDLWTNNDVIWAQSLTSHWHFLDVLLHLLLVSNTCGECDTLRSREMVRKESPERGRIP